MGQKRQLAFTSWWLANPTPNVYRWVDRLRGSATSSQTYLEYYISPFYHLLIDILLFFFLPMQVSRRPFLCRFLRNARLSNCTVWRSSTRTSLKTRRSVDWACYWDQYIKKDCNLTGVIFKTYRLLSCTFMLSPICVCQYLIHCHRLSSKVVR